MAGNNEHSTAVITGCVSGVGRATESGFAGAGYDVMVLTRVDDDQRGPIIHAGTLTLGVRCSDQIPLEMSHDRVQSRFEVTDGDRCIVGVVASDADPLFMCSVDAIDHRIDVSARAWCEWSKGVVWAGADREQIVRSALALKTLVIAETGAVAAAATTSLPESIGGPKNWDYRYSWTRDAAFTIDSLSLLGLHEEVHSAVAWLLHAIENNGPDLRVMYTLSGNEPDGGVRSPELPGYRHSLPVQLGNSASGQTQLGVYGDLFGTVANWVFHGHVLDVGSNRQLATSRTAAPMSGEMTMPASGNCTRTASTPRPR